MFYQYIFAQLFSFFAISHNFLSELGDRDKRELIKYYEDIDDDAVDGYLESNEDNGDA